MEAKRVPSGLPGEDDVHLETRGLSAEFSTYRGVVRALRGVDLKLHRARITGLVGETGSGKSVTARCVLQLVRPPGKVTAGQVLLNGMDLLARSEAQMRRVRGKEIAMTFQNARASLNPLFTIEQQMHLILARHEGLSQKASRARILELLQEVRIADPERRLSAYPHELSTGMCQRVTIAMGLSCRPQLLIADEPTTGLDVTIQAQVLSLFRRLVTEYGSTAMIITHDLGVVAETCEYVAVMYAGQVVEFGSTAEVFASPFHPYTKGLLASSLSGLVTKQIFYIKGLVPDLIEPIAGCAFCGRCVDRVDSCAETPPPVVESEGHVVRCHLHQSRSN